MDGTAMSHSKPMILLVDDQHSIRHILSAGLKANGFEVLTAASREKALAFCEGFERPIDLLLSDISLTSQELWPQDGMEDEKRSICPHETLSVKRTTIIM
jgi:response regulator RpfG family c-di-GMP phosphodiesterase